MKTTPPPDNRRVRMSVNQHWWRTAVKTAGYRLVMIVITIAVAFAFTGDVTAAVNIGVLTNAIKTATYYGYERFWARISWGTL